MQLKPGGFLQHISRMKVVKMLEKASVCVTVAQELDRASINQGVEDPIVLPFIIKKNICYNS